MKVLVDSSVWVAHWKAHDARFAALLVDDRVVCHPHVLVEIAAGTPTDRRATLALLRALRQAPVATHAEVLAMIEERRLDGRGCGMVDLCLLASVLLSAGTRLWTLDRRLHALAVESGCAYSPAVS